MRQFPSFAFMPLLLSSLTILACGTPAAQTLPTPPEPRAPTVVEREDALLRSAGVDPRAIRCNRENRWGALLRGDADAGAQEVAAALGTHFGNIAEPQRAQIVKKIRDIVFWRMVRAVLLEGDNNNFGVLPLPIAPSREIAGQAGPLLLFRTGLTPAPEKKGSCFQSLLEAGRVKHVVNLFDGDLPADDLVAAEQRAAKAAGATYHTATDAEGQPDAYGPWRDALRKHWNDRAKRDAALRNLARLVREQILLPGGKPPAGNIHLHCGGGMHRTGMVVGVLQKCVSKLPMAVIEVEYRRHTAWKSEQEPGGAEDGNVAVLEAFDCGLLGVVGSGAGPAERESHREVNHDARGAHGPDGHAVAVRGPSTPTTGPRRHALCVDNYGCAPSTPRQGHQRRRVLRPVRS